MTNVDPATSRRALLAGALGVGGLAAVAGNVPFASAASLPPSGLVDFFIKIDGIDGESSDSQHKNEINVLNWAFGVTSSVSALGSAGGGVGKSKPSDFTFVKLVDRASPKLFGAVCTGKHIKTATLVARKAGDKQQEFLKITLTDVLVTSYQISPGGQDGFPLDVVHLDYAKIKYAYDYVSPAGGLSDPIVFTFDFKSNKSG